MALIETLQFAGTMFSGAMRIAIPICFGALGSTICERAGIVNIGIEGMMLAGSFGGVVGALVTGSPWIGLLFAMVAGMLFSLLHGVLTIHYGTGHIISGLGVNLLASGVTTVLLVAIWQNRGKSEMVGTLPTIELTFLKKIPFIGQAFGSFSPLFLLLLAAVALLWVFLYKTTFGLRARIVGESPQTADAAGISVPKMQYICVLLCGLLCGLGGAYLSIGDIGMFSRDMVAGRGYIAMAVTIFGAWNPIGALGGGLLFGLAQSLQFRLQQSGIPVQLIQMLPYVITILVLLLVRRKGGGPAAAGKTFDREKH